MKLIGHYTDLSIDLETLGTEPGAVITQIGLTAFYARPQSGGEASMSSTLIHVDPQSCIDKGLHVSWSTISWWLQQADGPRLLMAGSKGQHIALALPKVNNFIAEHMTERFKVWGNGATFDVTLLNEAYRACSIPVPWQFRDIRDMRTLYDLAPCQSVERSVPKMEHNAMDDASAQAEFIRACVSKIERQHDHIQTLIHNGDMQP